MYFNHAFQKMFLGTQVSGALPLNPNPNLVDGFLITAGIPTSSLGTLSATAALNYGPGSYGFFDPNTWTSVNAAGITGCCPLVLASAAIFSNDKIGPMAGGYKESNKSKIIKPKSIHRFMRIDPCTPQQSVVSIGNTVFTDSTGVATHGAIVAGTEDYVNGVYPNTVLTGGSGSGVLATVTVAGNNVTVITITTAGVGYNVGEVLTVTGLPVLVPGTPYTTTVATLNTLVAPNCCFEFLCGETYFLRLEIKGSPTLRYLNHNAYHTLDFNTGCCPADCLAPSPVDSTLVMIGWSEQILGSPIVNPFVFPVVYDEAGVAWFPPNTTVDPQGNAVTSAQWWSNYVSTGHTAGACAGIRLFGAFVGTVFSDCTFQSRDFFEKEPVTILASLVDETGDPCTFTGLCVITECPGMQGMGFGDTILKDLMLSESYLQNYVSQDLRIREITQGNQIIAAINRAALYTKYQILHSVPIYNNPTGTYQNDQYLLEIISTGTNATFETFMTTWLDACAECVSMETYGCTPCVIDPI